MKKTIIVGFLSIGVNVYAQGDLIVEGKVGIGTQSPETKLHVYESGEYGLYLKIENVKSGGKEAGIGFSTTDSSSTPQTAWILTADGRGDLRFVVGGLTRMFIGPRIGIGGGRSLGAELQVGRIPPGTDTTVASSLTIRGEEGLLDSPKKIVDIYNVSQSPAAEQFAIELELANTHILNRRGNLTFQRVGGNVGIGTTAPTEKLEVAGRVKAQEFITGDITFQKDGEKLWRMFEDEEGLYIENLKTGKVYRFVLQEVEKQVISK
jgi:hypothetical protein